LEPYRKGMELAVEEVNAAGGVNGKKLDVITRDDNANPGDAVRAAEELVSREKVSFIMGGFLSNIGVALADFAKPKKMLYLASDRGCKSRRDFRRAVRRRSRQVRARGGDARAVQGPLCRRPAHRRARIYRSIEGRGAG